MLTYQSQMRENPLIGFFQKKWKKALSTITILGAFTLFLFILTQNPQLSQQRKLESDKSKDDTSMYAQASSRAVTPQPPPQTHANDDDSGSHPVAVEPKPLRRAWSDPGFAVSWDAGDHAAQSQNAESPSICPNASDSIKVCGKQFYNAAKARDAGYIRDSFLSEACGQDQMPSMNGDFTVAFNTKMNAQLEMLSVVLTTFDIDGWLIRKLQEHEFVLISERAVSSAGRRSKRTSVGRLWTADRVKKKIGCKLECVLQKKYRCECIKENWDWKNRSGTFEYRCKVVTD